MIQRYFKSEIPQPIEEKVDRLVAYLQKFPIIKSTANEFGEEYDWVPKKQILTAARGARLTLSEETWMLFESLVNIGRRWNKDIRDVEYRYYKPRIDDDLQQKAIDEF